MTLHLLGVSVLSSRPTAPMPSPTRFRDAIITLFVPPDWALPQPFVDACRYCCIGHEVSPKTGSPHAHLYAAFHEQLTMKRIKALLGVPDAHIEHRWGTRAEARDYVAKEDSRAPGTEFKEHGTLPPEHAGGKKTTSSLSGAIDLLKAQGMHAVAEEMPDVFVRSFKGLKELSNELRRSTALKPMLVVVVFGDAGVGKSRWVRQQAEACPGGFFELAKNGGTLESVWFDGYEGQQCLVLNDFYGKGFQHSMMLRLLDIYPNQFESKGSTILGLWDTVFITSNVSPERWYRNVWEESPEKKEAFFRRVHVIIHASRDGWRVLKNAGRTVLDATAFTPLWEDEAVDVFPPALPTEPSLPPLGSSQTTKPQPPSPVPELTRDIAKEQGHGTQGQDSYGF